VDIVEQVTGNLAILKALHEAYGLPKNVRSWVVTDWQAARYKQRMTDWKVTVGPSKWIKYTTTGEFLVDGYLVYENQQILAFETAQIAEERRRHEGLAAKRLELRQKRSADAARALFKQ
jgi:hypothetical protein